MLNYLCGTYLPYPKKTYADMQQEQTTIRQVYTLAYLYFKNWQ